jgi:uncharacterized protein YdeI (YjbR/CyaY-like superfamily)
MYTVHMEVHKDLRVLFFVTANDWEQWLVNHAANPQGIWIKLAKKASGIQSISYDEALDVALCYGWIDGLVNSLDANYYLQKFTPRRPQSTWSKRNIVKIADLTRAGKMQPSGLAEVERAKQDGRWEQAYDSPSTMTIPPDFQQALDKYPKAKDFFASLNKTNSYAFLWRIQTAKKPETRQTRIDASIAMLLDGKTFHI